MKYDLLNKKGEQGTKILLTKKFFLKTYTKLKKTKEEKYIFQT